MELTTKGRYAVMAMADLALHCTGVPGAGRDLQATTGAGSAGAETGAQTGAGAKSGAKTGEQSGAPVSLQSVPLSAISDRQEISLAYLEQIFGALRRAGLVTSVRGRSGGYRLAHAPGDISVGTIMSAVDEGMAMIRCGGEQASGCVGEARCQTHELWTALGLNIASFLADVSLKDLVDGVPASDICNAHSIAECARFSARNGKSSQPAKAHGSANRVMTAAEWTIK